VLAGTVLALVTGVAVLAAGIAIGNAFRRRIDRWRRGY
jgi:hypothetical protein